MYFDLIVLCIKLDLLFFIRIVEKESLTEDIFFCKKLSVNFILNRLD